MDVEEDADLAKMELLQLKFVESVDSSGFTAVEEGNELCCTVAVLIFVASVIPFLSQTVFLVPFLRLKLSQADEKLSICSHIFCS